MGYAILKLFAVFGMLSIAGYSLTPKKYRHVTLLAVSLGCVAYYSKWAGIYLVLTILTTFFAGIIMEWIAGRYSMEGLLKQERKVLKARIKKEKRYVVMGFILFNLGILFLLKYFGMFFPTEILPKVFQIAMPLGISYYTLQSLSYVIDVYRGKYAAEQDPLKLALFVAFLPQLHEGPFGRYDALKDDLYQNERIRKEDAFQGLATILWGLFKIFLISNRAAMVSDHIFQNFQDYGGFTILVGGAFFTLQLYAEFSGYIDIARGISEIFGIHLAQNFNKPFLSKDVAEFWRKWHISLGEWFRDYVFYPVSTAKVLKKVPEFLVIPTALLAVWFLTGLWHGASFKYVAYGLYYFVLMLGVHFLKPHLNRFWEKVGVEEDNKVLGAVRIGITWILVVIGMILFRADNVAEFVELMGTLFTEGAAFSILSVLDAKELAVLLGSLVILLSGTFFEKKGFSWNAQYNRLSYPNKYLVCFAAACFIIVFGAYGLDYMPPDPIYGGF